MSAKHKVADVRSFLSVTPGPRGLKYVYIPRSRKMTRTEVRSRLRKIGVCQKKGINKKQVVFGQMESCSSFQVSLESLHLIDSIPPASNGESLETTCCTGHGLKLPCTC